MKRPALAALFMAVAGRLVASLTPSVSARLEPEQLAAGDLTTLQISIAGSLRLKGSPDLALENFQIVAGPSLENRFEWINGHSSSQTILIYRLRALKPGRASAGPIRITDASGRVFESPQVTATVEKSAEKPSDLRPAPVSADPALVARLEPSQPYPGQQAVWTLYLVTRGMATHGEIQSLPDFKGFWAEELDRESNVLPQSWNAGGQVWHAYPMVRKALFANRPGTFAIGPARAIVAIRSDVFDIFGDSPFSDSRPVVRQSIPISVDCRTIPAEARRLPVGSFGLKVSVDRPDVPQGGSFSVSAAISGDGRLADIAAPPLSIGGANVSEPETRLSMRRSPSRLLSTRTWQWVVTPARSGTLSIPALRIPTFNPASGRVVEVASAPLAVRAAGPAPAPPLAVTRPLTALPKRSSFPLAAVLAPAFAAVAVLLVAVGYRLGRSRSSAPEASRLEGSTERRIELVLEALSAAARRRGIAAENEVARVREERSRVAFSPQLSSREEELRRLELEMLRLARRWRVRL